MPDALQTLLAIEGVWFVAAAAFVASLVRGFAGFGTAMIYLPVATQHLPPYWALATLFIMDMGGAAPNLRGAWAVVNRGDLFRLLTGAAIAMPFGLLALGYMAPEAFRWLVSLLALTTVAILVSGLRYRGEVSNPMVYGTGVAGGFLGGVAGVPGPPVILFYMARPLPAAVIRATSLLYLFGFDFLMVCYLALVAGLEWLPVLLALALTVVTVLGNWLGGVLFVPGYERLYRAVAYIVILSSALMGLPIWG